MNTKRGLFRGQYCQLFRALFAHYFIRLFQPLRPIKYAPVKLTYYYNVKKRNVTNLDNLLRTYDTTWCLIAELEFTGILYSLNKSPPL